MTKQNFDNFTMMQTSVRDLNVWYDKRNNGSFEWLSLERGSEPGTCTLKQGNRDIYHELQEAAMYWILQGMVTTFICIRGNHDYHEEKE